MLVPEVTNMERRRQSTRFTFGVPRLRADRLKAEFQNYLLSKRAVAASLCPRTPNT